jgi:hypothetical protein
MNRLAPHLLSASIALAIGVILGPSLAAHGQAKDLVGDVVVYHLGDVDRPAIVVDPAGPVLHVFLAPGDVAELEASRWAEMTATPAEKAERAKAPAVDRAHARSGRCLGPCLSAGALTVTAADDADWSPR